jgi:hypothetical protein
MCRGVLFDRSKTDSGRLVLTSQKHLVKRGDFHVHDLPANKAGNTVKHITHHPYQVFFLQIAIEEFYIWVNKYVTRHRKIEKNT